MRISKLLVPLQNAVLGRGKTAQNHSPRTGKHHGSEGRRRRKKGGEKLPNVTSETHRKYEDFWATCPAPKRSSWARKDRAKPQPTDGETPWQWRTEKAEKGGEKLPNVTSETHRKWGFLSYLSRSKTRFLGEERPRKTTAPGRGTPWQWRTEKAEKRRRKTA